MKTFWRSPFLTLILLVIDTFALARLWVGSYQIRQALTPLLHNPINPIENYKSALPILLALWLCILARFKFYSHHERTASLNRIGPVFWSVIWIVAVIALYNSILKPDFSRVVIAGFAGAAFLYLFISRSLFRYLKKRAIEHGQGLVRALVIGSGELGHEAMSRIKAHPDIGFKILGFISAEKEEKPEEVEGYPVLGTLQDLVTVMQRHRVEELFFAIPDMKEDEIFSLIEEVQSRTQAVCKVAANMLYVIVKQAAVDEIIGLPVIAFRGSIMTPAQLLVKRVVDLIGGGILGLLLAPLALLFTLIIRLDSPGTALFAHERVGHNGRRFRMLKFRTMFLNAEPYAEAPGDQTDPRITRFGRFLRRTSLDEIPQVLNVLKGDMSLVGPRPEMPFIVDNYKQWQKARLRVKPGLTGLWQVAGRKNLPLHFNLEYDFYYVKNQSLALDAEILLRTIPAVIIGRGAY